MIAFFPGIEEMIINKEGQKEDPEDPGEVEADLINQGAHGCLINHIS